jgi:hypothetical protein
MVVKVTKKKKEIKKEKEVKKEPVIHGFDMSAQNKDNMAKQMASLAVHLMKMTPDEDILRQVEMMKIELENRGYRVVFVASKEGDHGKKEKETGEYF